MLTHSSQIQLPQQLEKVKPSITAKSTHPASKTLIIKKSNVPEQDPKIEIKIKKVNSSSHQQIKTPPQKIPKMIFLFIFISYMENIYKYLQ